MRVYSMNLRQRVLAACDGGMSTAEAAEAFSVSPAWVRRLKQRREGDEVPADSPGLLVRPEIADKQMQ